MEEGTIIYYNEIDIQHDIDQGDNIMQTIKNLEVTIETIISRLPDQLTEKDEHWINEDLPNFLIIIENLEHQSRSIIKEINNLNKDILSLIEKTNFNSNLILSIVGIFEFIPKNLKIFEFENYSRDRIDQLLQFDESEKFLSKEKPQASSIIFTLVEFFFTTDFMPSLLEFIRSPNLTFENLYPILSLIIQIEPFLSETYISLIVPYFMYASIDILSNQTLTNNSIKVAEFLTSFAPCMPSLRDQILSLFCRIADEGNSNIKYSFIKFIIKMMETPGSGQSDEEIKKTFLSISADLTTNEKILQEIFSFLPTLSEFIQFCDEDLLSIIIKSKNFIQDRFQCIVNIIEHLKLSKMDNFATTLLTEGIFHPSLYLTLIDKVESNEISNQLFSTLITNPDQLSKFDLGDLKMNDEIKKKFQDALDKQCTVENLKSMSFLLINMPKVPFFIQFVMRIVHEVSSSPELLDILSLLGKKCESKALISNFFNYIFKQFLSKQLFNYQSISLIKLLTEWIENSDSITCDNLLDNLHRIDYINLHSSVFPLISIMIKKTKNEGLTVNLLFKILFDTVPMHHSNWLINHLFKYMQKDVNLMKQCIELLIQHLSDPIKKDNSISLIYHAAIYESDFFRLDDNDFGYLQTFTMNDKEFSISLHPFHSIRRIYQFISNQQSIDINQLSLTIMKGNSENKITPNMDLTSIRLDPFEPIRLNKIELIDNPPSTPTSHHFLELLRQELYIGILFQNMDNDYLFRVLLLLPFTDLHLPPPSNSIQALLFNQCTNPLDFLESRHIFPFALKIFIDNGGKFDMNDIEVIFKKLIQKQFDSVSLAMICSSLFKLGSEFDFSSELIKLCLIECDIEIIRKSFLSLISPSIDKKQIIELIQIAMINQNRSKTKEFFILVDLLQIDKEIFVPYFEELEQFEFSHYSEVDETYIALLDLIPATEEMIKLTFDRLFAPPTCKNVNLPFVHTIESWRASLLFLITNHSIDYLKSLLTTLHETPNLIMKLTNDFSFKGRSGIINLGSTCYVNSLLQILNTFPNISLQLICKENDEFSPFVDRLKEILAELRFVRGSSLSIRPLVDTISNFNCQLQEDVEEFLNRVVNELNDHGCQEIASNIQGQLISTTQTADRIIASEKEDFYFLSLQTKGLSRLDEALRKYFEDSPIEGGYTEEGSSNKVDAWKRIRILKWPYYLCFQLQRWDFNYSTQERTKLHHKFEFPIQLDTETFDETTENLRYSLKGVIVHQGTAEEGHYFAIVQNDKSNDWYVCNDQSIDYFEISELPKWAFGISNDYIQSLEKVGTGYLLFYELEGIEQFDGQLSNDLELKLNQENQINWPNEIFYSEQFVLYIMDFLLFNTENVEIIKLALTALFKIAVVDEKTMETCNLILTQFVFTRPELCMLFFDFIDKEFGTSFSNIASLSDSLSKLILTVFQQIKDSTYPLMILLTNLNLNPHKRIMNLVLNAISFACQNLTVDWFNEDDCLLLILKYMCIEYPRDSLKMIIKQHTLVMNTVLTLLYEISMKKGVTESMQYLFDMTILNRIYPIVKKSDYFQKLLMKVNLVRPDLFFDIGNATNQVKQLLAPILSVDDANNDSEAIELSTDFLWETFPHYIFHKDENIRREITNLALRLLGNIDAGIEKFFEESFIHEIEPQMFEHNENEVPKKYEITSHEGIFPDPSAIPLYFIGLIPKACDIIFVEKAVSTSDYFLDILVKVSQMHPNPTALYFRYIAAAFFTTRDIRILKSVHDLLVYDYSLLDNFSPEDVDNLLSSNCAAKECVNLLFIFKEKANKSVMSGACVEYYFENSFDQGAELLIKMIQNGFVPGDFSIPETTPNVIKLKLANVLWNALPDKRDDLSQYMLNAISTARPFNLVSESPTVKMACDILNEYCPDSFQSVRENIVL